MKRARRPEPEQVDPIELAGAVPDAVAIVDEETGELVGWDETAAHEYLEAHGLPSPCDAECRALWHVTPWG
ncbi:hypothetical protein [Mycobacterium sp. URHB0021]